MHDDINRYMKENYQAVLYTGLVGKMMKHIHRTIENGHIHKVKRILEVGAGQGQHLNFVEQEFDLYVETDVTDYRTTKSKKSKFKVVDAEDLGDFRDEYFDRVIATCLLTHLTNPEKALREWRRVTKGHGYLDIWVPCEMGILLRISQKIFTKRKVLKFGVDYDSIQYTEHRNHFPMMNLLLKQVFHQDEIEILGIPFSRLPWDFTLVRIYRIRKIHSKPIS